MHSVSASIMRARALMLNRAASSGVVFLPGSKRIGKLLPMILKHVNQGLVEWQMLADNHVPPLWRLYNSTSGEWYNLCCWCFSSGPYDAAIISAWKCNRLCPRASVTHCMMTANTTWFTTHVTSLRCACAGKTRWLTGLGETVGSTRLMTQRACH